METRKNSQMYRIKLRSPRITDNNGFVNNSDLHGRDSRATSTISRTINDGSTTTSEILPLNSASTSCKFVFNFFLIRKMITFIFMIG